MVVACNMGGVKHAIPLISPADQEDIMPPPSDNLSPLSVFRAFVVQFRAETDLAGGHYIGRIEHVASGQATHFASLAELLGFISRVLTQVQQPSDASDA